MATSGRRSAIRRSASAAVAAGPSTSAPHDSSSICKPVPTCQESSTTRIHWPLRSAGSISRGCWDSDKVMRHAPIERQCRIDFLRTQRWKEATLRGLRPSRSQLVELLLGFVQVLYRAVLVDQEIVADEHEVRLRGKARMHGN